MNVPTKFINSLSDKDYHQLGENYQTAQNFRVRNRSHAILLSFQKYPIDEIATICGVHRNAVSRWLDGWNELGLAGLADLQKSGRPSILTIAEQEKAVEIGLKNPKFPHRQLREIKQATGKEISPWTLKRLVKKKTTFGKE